VELDIIYLILAAQAIVMSAAQAIYYAMRLRIESRKEQATRASFESMVRYHAVRLDLEEKKLELARNGGKK
jgi:hypothetical protein